MRSNVQPWPQEGQPEPLTRLATMASHSCSGLIEHCHQTSFSDPATTLLGMILLLPAEEITYHFSRDAIALQALDV
jgi:hypothetical protein